MRRWRRSGGRVPRLALLAAGVGAGVLSAEGGLRLCGVCPFPEWSPRHLHVADPELGLVPAAGVCVRQEGEEFSVEILTDSLGLRSDEKPGDADPVVAILGDSFAFGHGVGQRDVVSARLQDRLRSSGYPRAFVANAGVSSYGTTQAVGRLVRIAGAIRPKLVVLLFFEGNDPFDEARPPLSVDRGWVVRAGERVTWPRALKLRIKHASSVYRVLAEAFDRPLPMAALGEHPAYGFDLFLRDPTPKARDALQRTDRALGRFASVCRKIGATGVVAVIPTRYRADPRWWRFHCERFGLDADRYHLPAVAERVTRRLAELGIPAEDMFPCVAVSEGEESTYFDASPTEVHLNARGHDVLSRALFEWIERERWLRRPDEDSR